MAQLSIPGNQAFGYHADGQFSIRLRRQESAPGQLFRRLERLQRVFRPLRRLYVDTDHETELGSSDALLQTLLALRNLESLRLKIDWIDFFKLFGANAFAIYLPQLRDVTITNRRKLNAARFLQLLSWCCSLTSPEGCRHEDQKEKTRPLKCLRLMDIILSQDASWRSILDDLKTHHKLQDRVVRLELQNVVDRELPSVAKHVDETWFSWGNSVMEYLNDGGPFPLRTRKFWHYT